jgi:alpha-galactosidase
MNSLSRAQWIVVFWLASAVHLCGQANAHLQNSDSAIELQAGSDVPRLVSLRLSESVWKNLAPERLIDTAYSNGEAVPLHWELARDAGDADERHVSFVYRCASPALRLTWEWQVRSESGPVEHTTRIENLGDKELWIPLQDSLQFDWDLTGHSAVEQLYIEKGAGTPSAVGTHLVRVESGYKWRGTSSTYAHPKDNEPREVIPWFLVQENAGAQNGWYVGIEFSGRTQLSIQRDGQSLKGSAGLNPEPGPFRTRLAAGESFETPTIFLAATHGGVDAAGNSLKSWVRSTLGNPVAWKDPNYPITTNNSWGSGMNVTDEIARRMIQDSAELGLEMFHIDAGWFRGVGDWYPNPQKFPQGLAAIADDAHQHGLKFGLWVDWTQAALDTQPGALNVNDPKVRDWMVTDLPPGWQPEEFKGQTIDLGVPEAKAWAQKEVERIVDDYHLDMLEHDGYLVAQGCDRTDHPHAPPDNWNKCVQKNASSYWVESSNSSDVSYHAVRAYYDIYSKLRKDHPGILLEVCNDGGRMVDFGSAAHADYFSITDTYDPLSNRRAFYDTSHVLPSAMLESYVEKWPTPRIENFKYMLRSGMMGWLTIMQDTNAWTPEQHAVAKAEIDLYKTKLRELIRDAELYHISPRPDGVHWDAHEYFDRSSGNGVVFIFRGSAQNEPIHTFLIQGLDPDATYRLRFHDHSSSERAVSGRTLMKDGLRVALGVPQSSELVFITKGGR